ncbi:nucleoside transporter-domain-containing protein [Chaetomidium leptoderma]|uniref:Nucleoside transporter-domain-containing protein n=1 Tax=Chaetomidium leptoderma TaxID=669021 RepID=A0AAN6VTR0_9PEZI|nr:nucleoside transporter-domain-containing protein [Chaetomidium leptoderma]
MDRIKAFFAPPKASADEYEPLTDDDSTTLEGSTYEEEETPFSWVEYSIFALIGVAMLWAWNMFLAAAPYFQTRFQSDPWIYANSQSAIITTSTVFNLVAMLILTNIQSSANYPFRINTALFVNAAVFGLLTLSTTSSFLDVSPRGYLAFILLMVAMTAWAAGLMQNGAFSFAASFGRPEYTQAIMAGQGVAGILPPLTQMLSFLAFADSSPGINPPDQPKNELPSHDKKGGTAAFIYFLTAVLISLITLLAFIPLVQRHNRLLDRRRRQAALSQQSTPAETETETDHTPTTTSTRRYVPLPTLFRKLGWLAASVFMCFVVTMFFPVFTAKILSVNDDDASSGGSSSSSTSSSSSSSSTSSSGSSKLLLPGAFIPLGFFFWNLGDLAGRVSTMLPVFGSLRRRPRVLFVASLLRWGFLPLYLLCNLHGRGAVVGSDLFYLVVVQALFGLTNGWLGSTAMMAAGEWVGEGEREAAGGFMSMCLVAGLAAGSVLSFTVAGI